MAVAVLGSRQGRSVDGDASLQLLEPVKDDVDLVTGGFAGVGLVCRKIITNRSPSGVMSKSHSVLDTTRTGFLGSAMLSGRAD